MNYARSFFKTIKLASHWTNQLCWLLAGFFLIMMLSLVGMQVVARYMFFSPPQWTEEAARYCMVWMGLLGATVSYYHRMDPVLFPLKDDMNAHLRFAMKIVQAIAVGAFVVPLVYFGPGFIERHTFLHTESLQMNTGLVVAVVPFFAAVICLHIIADLLPGDRPNNSERYDRILD